MKIVWVKWRDSHFLFDQHSIENAKAHRVAIFETVGYLVSEDADRIILAAEWLPLDSDVRQITAIPKENIVKKRILK